MQSRSNSCSIFFLKDDERKTKARYFVWIHGEPSSAIRNGLPNMHKEQKYREGKDEKNGSNRVKGVETKSKQALGA